MSSINSKIDTGKYFPLNFQLDTEVFARRRLKVLWRESAGHRYLIAVDVLPGGIGARIGLKEGDRLGMVNGKPLPGIHDLDKLTRDGKKKKKQDRVSLVILRKKTNETGAKRLPKQPEIQIDAVENVRKIPPMEKDVNDCSYFRYDQPDIELEHENPSIHSSSSNQSSYETARDWKMSQDSKVEFSFYEEEPETKTMKAFVRLFSVRKFPSRVVYINHKQNKTDNNDAAGIYLANKENYPPEQNPDPMGDSLPVTLKKYEKASFSKLSLEPDFIVKEKIDHYVKSQRALRTIGQNNIPAVENSDNNNHSSFRVLPEHSI